MKKTFFKRNGVYLHGVELILGEYYYLYYYGKFTKVKLIQVTEFGYNFLNEEINRCILNRHLYVPKNKRERYKDDKKMFLITNNLHLYKKVGEKDGNDSYKCCF